ncbi:DNA-processing protein DprA [Pedobacter flavus]|uniref:DNA-processing protein DprA n=1 Tax=Pedobacter flavus TaxID=3113906 RepID=A0ABU7H1Q8_9SPHI|nr:DNA-processing protein DprA [Pedobacter sp. VNH31]MEE1885259.1 DNA-processing protein DprA [Pedobacter sp. VNH31]
MSKLHQLAITKIEGVGYVLARLLIKHFGDASLIFKATKKQLMQIPGIGPLTAESIKSTNALKLAEEELRYLEKNNVQLIYYTDDNYPRRLRNCNDAPIILYYKGVADLNHLKILSVVGTRNATAYGRGLCEQLAASIYDKNILIISGLAYGIDIHMHSSCVKNNIPTIGILGHGVDRIYPRLHANVANQMLENGGILSEFPLKSVPDRENFPKRNRVIAGMADGVIVIEAAKKGGALITAELANSYNRDVFAYPGRAGDYFSEGCNFLIKTNKAALVQSADDILYYLGWDKILKSKPKPIQKQMPLDLSELEKQVYLALEKEDQHIDKLCVQLLIPQSKLNFTLVNLELKGIIKHLPGNMFALV